MFIKFIKEISLKKNLKKKISSLSTSISNTPVKKIGILIDENYFQESNKLIEEIQKNGIKPEDISILIYKKKENRNRNLPYLSFTKKDLNKVGEFKIGVLNDFVKAKFDLLISYYDVEKIPLLLVTHQSMANFKVGFSNVDKRLNHLMISTTVENYKTFIQELFKYLKILNKI